MAFEGSRTRTATVLLLAIGARWAISTHAQSQTQIHFSKYDSPTIRQLSLAIRDDGSAVLEFFKTHASAPLIEPIEGDREFRWITFLVARR